MSCHVIGINN